MCSSSHDSSRSTTPRSGTPSQHLDSDLLMELDFASGSHESLSDFRSRTSSAGSRDFPSSSGFGGSHDIRDRTGSTGSRDSLSTRGGVHHDLHVQQHRPRTSTIGQDTLRPRTSSFGRADMRPRALSHGNKLSRDLSRVVKEKQLRLQDPKGKLRSSTSRDSVGAHHAQAQMAAAASASHAGTSTSAAAASKQSELLRSRSQEYKSTLPLPQEEYMTLSPPGGAGGGGGALCTAGDSPGRHSSRHSHMSPETKAYIEQNHLGGGGGGAIPKRASFKKDRSQAAGSSSESLSSSSSEKGLSFKHAAVAAAKHSARAKKGAAAAAAQSKMLQPKQTELSEYMDASPQSVVDSLHDDDVSDSYFVYDPSQASGQGAKLMTTFSLLEKVTSPIRDDLLMSTFQIASPIKEEDNDQLFGPKPKSRDKETLDRLKGLKHEYVNVQFDDKNKQQQQSSDAHAQQQQQCGDVTSSSSRRSDAAANVSLDDDSGVSSDAPPDSGGADVALGGATAAELSSPVATRSDVGASLSPGRHGRGHEYMEIDFSAAPLSSDAASRDVSVNDGDSSVTSNHAAAVSTRNDGGSPESKAAQVNTQSNGRLHNSSAGGGAGGGGGGRQHEYCEIDFDNVTDDMMSSSTVAAAIPDPFGELSPLQTTTSTAGGKLLRAGGSGGSKTSSKANRNSTKQQKSSTTHLLHTDTRANITRNNNSLSSLTAAAVGTMSAGGSARVSPQPPSSTVESSQQIVADLVAELRSVASHETAAGDVDRASRPLAAAAEEPATGDDAKLQDKASPPPIAIDVFNLGAKPATPRDGGRPASAANATTASDGDSDAVLPDAMDVFNLGAKPAAKSPALSHRSSAAGVMTSSATARPASLHSDSGAAPPAQGEQTSGGSGASLTRSSISALHSSSSSSSLETLTQRTMRTVASAATLNSASSTCRNSADVSESALGSPMLNYARLDLSACAGADDQPSVASSSSSISASSQLHVITKNLDASSSAQNSPAAVFSLQQRSPSVTSQRSPSFMPATTTSGALQETSGDLGNGVSYAEIDFEKCEQLRQKNGSGAELTVEAAGAAV